MVDVATDSGTQIALIIEDNADVREIYVAELQRMGWESVTALLEEDIRTAVSEYTFDIALLDSHFPGIPVERLKTLVEGVPFVIVSLDDSHSGYNVIQKPFLLDEFRYTIETVVIRDGQRFAEGDVVRSKITPELEPGVVIQVSGERVCVQFGHTQRESGGRAVWCHQTGLVRIRRRRDQ